MVEDVLVNLVGKQFKQFHIFATIIKVHVNRNNVFSSTYQNYNSNHDYSSSKKELLFEYMTFTTHF